MIFAPHAALVPAADSARVVAHLYTVSMSALIPVGIAALAAFALRNAQAAARAAVWRASVLAMLAVFLGGMLPIRQIAWVVPTGLASPLIVLGRLQVDAPVAAGLSGNGEAMTVELLSLIYLSGVAIVLLSLVRGAARLSRQARAAAEPDARLVALLAEACGAATMGRPVSLRVSSNAVVPMTWGFVRPTILLPASVASDADDRVRAVLIHELTHARVHDATFALLGRLSCALLWFHPAAWWVDRRLHAESEMACDDRVLAAGVRQSDYAELLADSCDRLSGYRAPAVAVAMCERTGLRQRIDSIVDASRDRRRPAHRAATVAAAFVLLSAAPAGLTRLAPTRSVLDSLMQDGRWESRAYAVLGLAQRADSIEVARAAAVTDPDPNVRAWARYAISLEPVPAPLAPDSH